MVDAVFVTTAQPTAFSEGSSPESTAALCRRNRIPINVVDHPTLSTFTLLSTHADGPLQIGITTNGRGCHLASRIRREVAAALPTGLGAACARLGEMRRRVQQEDRLGAVSQGVDDEEGQDANFNRLVTEEDLDAAKNRRMRWLAQVCEYWPLKRLAAVTDEDVETILKSYPGTSPSTAITQIGREDPSSSPSTPKAGCIILAGSGPGHPDLLTRATHKALLTADLILADKLVPAAVLDLIPRRTPVTIARKFPGNADQAQDELLTQGLAGVRAGKRVLRLKQGDPFLYGRGGEEVAFFRAQGVEAQVLPGVTSALSAPLFAGVPATQRDVADSVLICTGTGKKGKPPAPPECVAGRTCVFLMALHRVAGLVGELTAFTAQELGQRTSEDAGEELENSEPKPTRALWPLTTPCAVIERASCPDQRVIRTTLRFVAEAVEQEGSRPPGLLVVGRACEALYTPEKGRAWIVEEGFRGLDGVDGSESVGATLAGLEAVPV